MTESKKVETVWDKLLSFRELQELKELNKEQNHPAWNAEYYIPIDGGIRVKQMKKKVAHKRPSLLKLQQKHAIIKPGKEKK